MELLLGILCRNFIVISSLSALTSFGCMQDTLFPVCTQGSVHKVNMNVFKVDN